MGIANILFFKNFIWYIHLIIYLFLCLNIIFAIIFFVKKNDSALKICLIISLCFLFILVLLLIFKLTGILEELSSAEKIQNLLSKYKGWSYAVFCFLEILNVVVLPIPALILHIAGATVFGPWLAFLLAFLSVFIGSVIAFLIGRVFGKKVVIWCVGKEITEKYRKLLNKNGKIAFILMQLLPFFPDDVLCFVAGISTMTWKFFIAIMLTIRPIYIILACFFGTGQIIPFTGWGIPIWIIIFIATISLFIIYSKNSSKIEKLFLNLKQRKKKVAK